MRRLTSVLPQEFLGRAILIPTTICSIAPDAIRTDAEICNSHIEALLKLSKGEEHGPLYRKAALFSA